MLEQEAWGQLTKKQFDLLIEKFTQRFGEPTRHRRLSISFWNHQHNEVDTRIRITDGQGEVMQKIGKWDNATNWDRTERYLKLSSDADQVFNAYKILRQLLPSHEPCQMIQHDNYVFKTADFEIKLSHQIGKSDKYNFEVETLSGKSSLDSILKDLGLTEFVTVTDVAFWDKWNQDLNISDADLNEKQILRLIKKYL